MHPIQDLFLKVFHMYYNLICILICTPMWTKKFILVKSGRYSGMGPPWTEAAWIGGWGGTVPARGARALGLAGDGGEGQAGRGGARGVLT
jgi:hypothetical protein